MEQVRLACGHRSETPYILGRRAVRIYSPEELCYSIMLESYLLDEEFASYELAEWLGTECGLPDLEEMLRDHLRSKGSVDGFAAIIMEYVGFYPSDIIAETCAVIRDNASLSIYEKSKARADYMLMCGHLTMALSAYNELLETIPEREKTVRSSIWHNCGYVYARMFRFSEAAKAFYCAWKCLPSDDSLEQFLTALRLSRDDHSYLEYVTAHPEFYEASQKVEKSIGRELGAYEGTDEHRMIMALQVLREEDSDSEGSAFRTRLDEIMDDLKYSYREMVSL